MKFNIHNHNNTGTISVEHMPDAEGLVMVTSTSAWFSFTHLMTAEQAQFMAGALLMAAENAEQRADVQHVPADDTEGGAV